MRLLFAENEILEFCVLCNLKLCKQLADATYTCKIKSRFSFSKCKIALVSWTITKYDKVIN